ncbi:MAG: hypothetical protein AB7O43_04465 [Hyphomicrobiaceae bacterium]
MKRHVEGGSILRRSSIHNGLTKVFVVLFALLAIVAPTFDAPLPGSGFGEYVSAPDDRRSDTATLLNAAPYIAEDLEEDADEDEADRASFPVLATLDRPPDAEFRGPPSVRRPSA